MAEVDAALQSRAKAKQVFVNARSERQSIVLSKGSVGQTSVEVAISITGRNHKAAEPSSPWGLKRLAATKLSSRMEVMQFSVIEITWKH